ncbi:unnamed protein product [Diatraea saccharalis]|uniref:Major facilitator superfamily (MFS) profile domain-containing protein n=1 Tax=Diatraea saccharalis TaxID=40085 RepID=A0A9N9RB60_9NEOP|nr:unnamed protein product [Diatraea saccharalis]
MGKGKLYQTLTAVASAFGSLIMGMLYVWPSYTVSLFKSENTTILSEPMSSTEVSLLGSLPSLGAMLGTALAGPLIETFGRKLGGLAITLPYVLAWAIIAVSKSSTPILAARFISGISGGGNLVYAPIFISEVAEDSIRGSLASATIAFYGIGALTSYLLGWFFTYNNIIWLNLVVSVIGCGLLLIVAESPVYLLKKNREEDARISLAIYRGAPAKSMLIEEELSRLKHQICPVYEMVSITEKSEETEKEKLDAENLNFGPPQRKSGFKTLMTSPTSRRAFLVVSTVITMQVLMGIVPVQVYAKHVFTHADPGKADLYSVIFAVVLVAGSFVTGAIADKAGRRILIITSSAMVCICMSSLGFLLQTRLAPSWVTVAMIFVYCFCFMFGAGSIPYVLLAEVFSSEVQAVASSIIIEWVWFLNFVVLAAFTWLNEIIGIHGIFYIFAFNACINAFLSFFFLPETKGLSNMQIQEIFSRNRRK